MGMKNQNGIMISCKKATELIEQRENSKIGIVQIIKLKIHLMMCSACKVYEKQSALITGILEKNRSSIKENQLDRFELEKLKTRIKKRKL